MRVQHPEKRQHTIAPVGEEPIETEENGIAEVPDKLGRELVAQGWTRTDKPKSRSKSTASAAEETDASEPDVEDTPEDTDAGASGEEG